MYTQNEILFPHSAISALRNARGPKWQALVEDVLRVDETHERSLAFMLMMINLNGCLECETDSYRAMRGCQLCALQTLRRYKGTDESLLEKFDLSLVKVREMLDEGHPVGISPRTNTEYV
jgi:hypothetical protein